MQQLRVLLLLSKLNSLLRIKTKAGILTIDARLNKIWSRVRPAVINSRRKIAVRARMTNVEEMLKDV